MDFIDSYQVKGIYDYVTLKDIAQDKLFNVSVRWSKLIIEGAAAMLICLILSCVYLAIDDGFAITKAILYISVVINVYIAIFGACMILKGVKKLKTAVYDYQGDLRRIQEKLTWSDIYMEIPQEDLDEFKSIYKLIKFSVERMKKST